MDLEQNSLSTGRMSLGIAAGAVAGLILYVAFAFGVPAAVTTLAFGYEWKEWEGRQILNVVKLYLVFGLPVALLLSVAIGLPIWKYAEFRALHSRRDALRYGAATGASIGVLFSLLAFLTGLPVFFDESSTYNSWMYGYQVTRDGIPTLFGWLLQLINVFYFTLAGAIGGLVARWIALPSTMRG